MTPVDLELPAMRRVMEQEGGCLVWGGSARLSPADDVLIRVERPLDFDSDGQLVASVLSKKVAAGSNHVLIDMPIGPTAKVRSDVAAAALTRRLVDAGKTLGLRIGVHHSDGLQPVGFGIGPALEAIDVLKVLRNDADAPADLRERALLLAGALLDLVAGGRDQWRRGAGPGVAFVGSRAGKVLCDLPGTGRPPLCSFVPRRRPA